MKKLGVIALVAVGILAILQGASYLGIVLQMATSGSEAGGSLSGAAAYAAPAVAAFLIGTLLIAYRTSLADRWFEDGEISTSIDATSLVRIVLVAIGVWMVAFGVTAALGSVLFGLTSAVQGIADGMGPSILDILPRALPEALEIVIGVLLVIRSKPLARWLWKDRPVVAQTPARALPVCPSCGAHYDPNDYRDAEGAKCPRCKEPLPLPRA